MEDMSFRSGAAVTGATLAVVGAVIALAVMLTGHSAAATGTPSPDAAARLTAPSSSAPAPATSAASSGTPRPSHSKAPRTTAGTYAQAPSRPHAAAAPHASVPASSPSVRSTTWQPKPLKWTPGDPRRSAPPDWGWPG
jgi:hypothetical protein